MSVTGTVKNGVVLLPKGIQLPEGAEVKIESIETLSENDPFMATVLRLAKPRPHWPADFVTNHGHYVSGEPRKS